MARNAKNTRMCIACMTRRDKTDLVCVKKTQSGIVIGTAAQALFGRSLYMCPDKKCYEKSLKKKVFSRALRCEVSPEFYEDLKAHFVSLINEE